jgi:hypothetical protein
MRDESFQRPLISIIHPHSLRRGLVLISLGAAMLVTASFMGGCSAVRQISDAALAVQEQAMAASDDIDAAIESGDVGPKALPHLNSANDRLATIHETAGKVVNAIPYIEDSVPFWQTLIKWGLIAAAVLGVLALAIYSGVGAVARPAFAIFGGWVAWLIPKATSAAAKFDAEAVVEGGVSLSHDRSITASRVGDAAYEFVFEKEKANAEAKKTASQSQPESK